MQREAKQIGILTTKQRRKKRNYNLETFFEVVDFYPYVIQTK